MKGIDYMTIRELYEMALERDALDVPMKYDFYCPDDYYTKLNQTIEEGLVEVESDEVRFYLGEVDE